MREVRILFVFDLACNGGAEPTPLHGMKHMRRTRSRARARREPSSRVLRPELSQPGQVDVAEMSRCPTEHVLTCTGGHRLIWMHLRGGRVWLGWRAGTLRLVPGLRTGVS